MLKRTVHLGFLLVVFASALAAAPFSRIFSYGDSLSDPLFTNGPVAVELLADRLGVPLSNYAVGGATTGVGNYLDGGTVTTPSPRGGMQTQLAGSLAELNPSGALFVVWGGSNDFLAPAPGDDVPGGVVVRAVTNLVGIAMALQAAGAQHILVPGLPNLGLTPYYLGLPPPAAQDATELSTGFNTLLQTSLPPGVIFFDTAALMQEVFDNPSAFGFMNVTDSCLSMTGPCANPAGYMFWDGFHPTTAAHEILAERFAEAAVPEPATVVLVFAGLATIAAGRRLRVKKV